MKKNKTGLDSCITIDYSSSSSSLLWKIKLVQEWSDKVAYERKEKISFWDWRLIQP